MKNILFSILFLSTQFFSNSLFSQLKKFEGTWIKLNTTYVFDFDLVLNHAENNTVQGYFIWKVIKYDEGNFRSINHYKDKLGATGKEFVKGSYNPYIREYLIKGYKKEDPNNIIGLDTYHIKVDQNNDIGGTTNANGSHLGRINGKEVSVEVL
ncbi:MAG: hypothetical protein ACI81W_000827 [Saprospiraceae bacterium]|jgi:hypothetical protein